jgi:hypothetical protein
MQGMYVKKNASQIWTFKDILLVLLSKVIYFSCDEFKVLLTG